MSADDLTADAWQRLDDAVSLLLELGTPDADISARVLERIAGHYEELEPSAEEQIDALARAALTPAPTEGRDRG